MNLEVELNITQCCRDNMNQVRFVAMLEVFGTRRRLRRCWWQPVWSATAARV